MEQDLYPPLLLHFRCLLLVCLFDRKRSRPVRILTRYSACTNGYDGSLMTSIIAMNDFQIQFGTEADGDRASIIFSLYTVYVSFEMWCRDSQTDFENAVVPWLVLLSPPFSPISSAAGSPCSAVAASLFSA